MKTRFFTIGLLIFSIFCVTSNLMTASAQDYTQWGLPKGAKTRFGKGMLIGNIAYSPDGTQLAVSTTIGIWIYDAETGKELNLFNKHSDNWERVIAFSPDGKTIASGGDRRTHESLHLLDSTTGEPKDTLLAKFGSVHTIAFSSDGKSIAGGRGQYLILMGHYYGERKNSI